MRAEEWDIDPQRAAQLLATMKHNRTIATPTVNKYVKAMRAGRWQLTGQGISVIEQPDGSVCLLNGAHRMNAVIKSGTTQRFHVVFEEDEHVFVTFDTGRNRSTATILQLLGQPNANVVAAISKMLLLYDLAPDELWHGTDLVDRDEVVEWFENQGPDGQLYLIAAARLTSEMRRMIRSTGSWYGALMWLIREQSDQSSLLLQFHESVKTGAGLSSDSPCLALRNYMINATASNGRQGDLARQAALTVGIRAWNDWLNGEKKSNYKFQAGKMVKGKLINSSLPMPKVK